MKKDPDEVYSLKGNVASKLNRGGLNNAATTRASDLVKGANGKALGATALSSAELLAILVGSGSGGRSALAVGQDILVRADGSLDLPDDVLAELDRVVLCEAPQRRTVLELDGALDREPRDGPVHGARVQIPEPEPLGELSGAHHQLLGHRERTVERHVAERDRLNHDLLALEVLLVLGVLLVLVILLVLRGLAVLQVPVAPEARCHDST